MIKNNISLEAVSADIARRVPDMMEDRPVNNADMIKGMIDELLKLDERAVAYLRTCVERMRNKYIESPKPYRAPIDVISLIHDVELLLDVFGNAYRENAMLRKANAALIVREQEMRALANAKQGWPVTLRKD